MTRKSRTVESEAKLFRPVSGTTTGETVNDASHDDLSIPHATDPGLSRMFTDAALYERVLAAGPECVKNCLLSGSGSGSGDSELPPMCIGSFNELIGRDLGDDERMVTGRLAKLSVNNWDSSADDPFGIDGLSEEEHGELGSPDRGEDEKPSAHLSSLPPLQEEQQLDSEEPKLTPEEVVDLLEQEFGALAPPGEEKLLLETDAAFFKDVVILVGPPQVLHAGNDAMMAYVFLSCSRVSFTSLPIDSPFTPRSCRRSRVTTNRSSRLVRP